MHPDVHLFFWCASDLGDGQVQLDVDAEPVYAEPEYPADGVEEQTEV